MYERCQPGRLVAEPCHQFSDALLLLLGDDDRQCLGQGLDAGHRGLQLVGGVDDEVATKLLDPVLFRAVDDEDQHLVAEHGHVHP